MVTATFNMAADPSTVNAGNFYLNQGAVGTVSYDSIAHTATLTPSADLASGTTYTATITPSLGEALSADYTWTFTTMQDADSDGVPDDEDSYPNDPSRATLNTCVGASQVLVDVSLSPGAELIEVQCFSDSDSGLCQTGKPDDYCFSYGLVSFKVRGLTPGQTIQVTMTWPGSLPVGARYYKINATGFYVFPNVVFSGRTAILTLTDGGAGDLDGTANGVIIDPGGVAVPVASGTSGGGGGCFLGVTP